MRRFLLVCTAIAFVLIAAGVAIALSVHWVGIGDSVALTVGDERFDGPVLSAMVGDVFVLGAAAIGVTVVAVLATVAIVVPVVLVLVALFACAALVVGLSPLLLPVLLAVGGYALLSRSRRRASASTAGAVAFPSAPVSPLDRPHASDASPA